MSDKKFEALLEVLTIVLVIVFFAAAVYLAATKR
jgi:preprotein translocase subunit SecG